MLETGLILDDTDQRSGTFIQVDNAPIHFFSQQEGIEVMVMSQALDKAEEEIEYLMARGLTRDEATAIIVRGFLKVDIEGLPPMLSAELERAIQSSEGDFM
jgi:hypothetical protein